MFLFYNDIIKDHMKKCDKSKYLSNNASAKNDYFKGVLLNKTLWKEGWS